ncbi:tRNA ligase [Grosmannia clavigera kw1407]|uniref:tRNA ligase n=1 Tax=Grosmannia clavigera (strain kw1407 / UAMH 11150) TaxID=655863 RepID=F0XP92_GROCL|nr:tRNA ligase [Grosmannia clavigera kw1407]EFX00132.1 tRNA ligase [Grosmannia clavigera kw1407]
MGDIQAEKPASAKAATALAQPPMKEQDISKVADLIRTLEEAAKLKQKSGFSVKRTRFNVADSPDGHYVDAWKFNDWDYKRPDLPTYARGFFTTRDANGKPVIAVRGYDKFFNVNEVKETQWEYIEKCTQGPYELTLKENGCIIFVAGLEDGTLLVCSKHSTGDRADVTLSHSSAGEARLAAQLHRLGKSKEDLARELRSRNITAVAELCDDSFEEHILAYGPDKAGLYLHGINLNLPEFMTYPSTLVQNFAEQWGFRKTELIVMEEISKVRTFLEQVAESGAHDGRDVEGFVIRCKMSPKPTSVPFADWFFKYKFEEPYLMYRQWRECTKALISGRAPQVKKHQAITKEYLLYARKRIAANPNLGKLYTQNHGIIQLRNDFLAFKNLNGADAAGFEALQGGEEGISEVDKDVILVPIATIGCGKTTIALGLSHLLGYGHVQNDNITGPKRPPRFTRMLLDELKTAPAVVADRNNAQRHERKQLISDVKMQHVGARLVALNFVHDNIKEVRRVTQQRVFARGDNHQTIQAASDPGKVVGIMNGFVERFQPCDLSRPPDDGFDAVIDLDPTSSSRENLEVVVRELHRIYPKLVSEVPSSEELDEAISAAIQGYRPELRHTIPDRGRSKAAQNKQEQGKKVAAKKKPLEYVAVQVEAKEINRYLEQTFKDVPEEQSGFYQQLRQMQRVQAEFHVTLMHRASAKERPELWERYTKLQDEAEAAAAAPGQGPDLGKVDVQLERVVFDGRLMALVVRLVSSDAKGAEVWTCVNRVSHITVGTRDASVKPKESNDLLARWLDEGSTKESKIVDIGIEGRPLLSGVVRGVMSR